MSLEIIRSIAIVNPVANRILSSVEPHPNGCLLWKKSGSGPQNHAYFKLNGRCELVARWLYQQHFGALGLKELCCHKCDNPKCVNLDHIFIGSHKDNSLDMSKKGRGHWNTPGYQSGENNHRAKLTAEQVLNIRSKVSAGETKSSIAREFNVSNAAVRLIAKRKKWSHI